MLSSRPSNTPPGTQTLVLLWLGMNIIVLGFLSSGLDQQDGVPFFETRRLRAHHPADGGCNDNGAFDGPEMVRNDPCKSSTGCLKTPKNEIAACLQFKDDNHKLSEWIAYHYYVLPMRHLSILVDPNSFTSPQPILDQWNETMGLNIRVWSDEEVFKGPSSKSFIGKLDLETTPIEKLVDIHHARKRHFYAACMESYSKRGLSWVLLLDVDEYLLYNHIHEDEPNYATTYRHNNVTARYEVLPRTVQSSGHDYESEWYDQEASLRSQLVRRTTLPRVDEQKFADYIAEHAYEHPWLGRLEPCKLFPRLSFGPTEPTPTDRMELPNDLLDRHFNSSNFDTLRFFHHGQKGNVQHNSYGKALVDVSSTRVNRILQRGQATNSLRRPLGSLCTKATNQNSSLFVVYHYTGSEESFLFAPDKRRTKAQFERRRHELDFGVNYDMKPWLAGFVREVGLERAKELLASAGKLGNRDYLFRGASNITDDGVSLDELGPMEEEESSDEDDDDVLSFEEETDHYDPIPLNNETGLLSEYKSANNSVAVCMVYREQEHYRLPEWLAFHYFSLPLRNVTILMDKDATSMSSVTSILGQWNGTDKMGVNIRIVWTDDGTLHTPSDDRKTPFIPEKAFYRHCMEHYRNSGQKWLLLLDANEYILYNHIHPDEKGYAFNYDFLDGNNEQSTTLRLTNRLTMMDSVVDHDKGLILAETQARLNLPTPGYRTSSRQQTIGTYLWKRRNAIHWKEMWNPCRIIPRLSYSMAVEPTEAELRYPDAELGKHFDGRDFETLRFFHHAEKGSRTQNPYGKALINLRHSIVHKFLSNRTINQSNNEDDVDFPLADLCGHESDKYGDQNHSTFVINYYAMYDDERSSNSVVTNYDIKPWLSGFVRQVGLEKAKELLPHG